MTVFGPLRRLQAGLRTRQRPRRLRDSRRAIVERLGYGDNWPRRRALALRRDGYSCQRCGRVGRQLGKHRRWTVHVHHIVKIKNFVSDGHVDWEKANDLSNLVTLCPTCHAVADGHDNPKRRGFVYLR